MIDRLTGRLESIDGPDAVIVPEIGWAAFAVLTPAYLAERLGGRVGQNVELFTHLVLESQNQGATFTPRLLGFGSPAERSFFHLFTTVKGIGSRKALRAMTLEPAEIARAIVSHDTKWLTKLPEIGKRMAETVVAELDGKVASYLSMDELDAALDEAGDRAAGGALRGPAAEAVSALMALGETKADAERMVRHALTEIPEPESSTELIQAAYRSRR